MDQTLLCTLRQKKGIWNLFDWMNYINKIGANVPVCFVAEVTMSIPVQCLVVGRNSLSC